MSSDVPYSLGYVDSPETQRCIWLVETCLTEPSEINNRKAVEAMRTAVRQVTLYSDATIFKMLSELSKYIDPEIIAELERMARGAGRRRSTGELAPRVAEKATSVMNGKHLEGPARMVA